jgi:acetylornithine deacetylase/succinyl-diaminopimelate desuccinylase family protein
MEAPPRAAESGDALGRSNESELELALLAGIEAGEERLFDLLRELIRFRTPNPPGGNEREAQAWMEARMLELGLEVDRWDVLPGRPDVVGVLRGEGGGPTVVLNGHIDVCEDRLLEQWSTDPYEPVLDGRDMIGRGTSDMKSAAASFLYALDTLAKHGVRLRGNVVLQSVMGEEAGEPGTRSAIERGYGGDFAIVGESARGRDLIASIGVLNCRITIASPDTLHLQARRLTIHAGGGLEGANCIEKMASFILPALASLERQWAVFKTHPLVPPGVCYLNVFRMEGGGNPFMLPVRCDAHLTVTYLPHERREDVIAEVEERVVAAAALDGWLAKHPPRVEWSPSEHPIEFAAADFEPADPPVRMLAEAIRLASGEEARLGGRSGITDAGWFHQAGIPVVVFGPGDIQYAHAIDERVHLDDIVAHCQAIALFLCRYCGVV